MRITSIRSMRLFGPLLHGQGGETGGSIGKVIVRVDTDAGIHGLGEADDFMGVRQGIAYADHYFRGRDPFEAVPIIQEFMWASLPPHPPDAPHGVRGDQIVMVPSSAPTAVPLGPVAWVASAIDTALVDLIGKALGAPAYTLLGGKFRDRIRIYLDRSSPVDVGNLDAWRTMARDVVDRGFMQMKFDIDYVASDAVPDIWSRSLSLGQINRMVERLAVVRETVGPDFELCVDLHCQYNVPDAIRLANALAPLSLLWLEDPSADTDLDAYLAVKAASPIALCVGEMFIAEQFRLFIDHGAIDILHPDVLFCGGMHELRRIADYADLHRLPLAIHGNGGALAAIAAAHVAAASRTFLGLEYHFIETPWLSRYVRRVGSAADRSLFEDGQIVLSDAPGLGVELDEAVCRANLGRGEVFLT
jgi:L-alanine-DL-glutamate epimerase-like enolase superfamily enzyme